MKHLEHRLQRARDRFVAEIVAAIEEAIIDAVEEAFALARIRRERLTAPSRQKAHAAMRSGGADLRARTDTKAAARARVFACVRDAPGSHIGELHELLRVPASNIRRHLRELASGGAIRVETTRKARFGRPLQRFFPLEPTSDLRVDAPTSSVEAPA